ncbi:MAG: WD40 repeat domain-containing protein, partial [Myxococcales bacterium]|nr:WD40 repeat domain-containing protein [Myxococcales bacterium]
SSEPLALLADERNWIFQLGFAADGRTLVSTTEDGSALLWGLQPGLPTVALGSHEVQTAAFSGDGRRLVAGERRVIRIWDLSEGQALTVLEHSAEVINDALAWSADGSRVAAAEGRSIGLWDAESGKQIAMLLGHREHVRDLAFSRDGKTLASVGDDGTLRLWAAEGGEALASKAVAESPVTTLMFLPLGYLRAGEFDAQRTPVLASGGDDGRVRLWSAQAELLATLDGHQDAVVALASSNDGRLLASGGADTRALLWSLVDELPGKPRVLDGHSEAVFSLCFTVDDRLVTASAYDVLLWPAEGGDTPATPVPISEHRSTITALACAPRGDLVASAGRDGSIELWTIGDEPERYVDFTEAATVHQLYFGP